MIKSPLPLVFIGVVAAIALVGLGDDKSSLPQPSAASDAFWSGDMYDRYYSHCTLELRQSAAGLQPAAVHRAICDCHIAEVEKWLRPSDMTIILAAVDGESDAELEARALALPKSEAMASEKRMRQFTKSAYRTCVKAGQEAAANLLEAQ